VTAVVAEVCVGAVIVHDERLLLIRRGRGVAVGSWSIPGGRVEPGEPVAAAVVREVAEETGLSVVCGELLGWVERIGDDHHYVILDFTATLLGDRGGEEAHAVAGDDASEVRWVPINDVAEMSGLVDGLAEFLHDHGVIPTIV
jgi:8-oxo-dGTP diphosphatase